MSRDFGPLPPRIPEWVASREPDSSETWDANMPRCLAWEGVKRLILDIWEPRAEVISAELRAAFPESKHRLLWQLTLGNEMVEGATIDLLVKLVPRILEIWRTPEQVLTEAIAAAGVEPWELPAALRQEPQS